MLHLWLALLLCLIFPFVSLAEGPAAKAEVKAQKPKQKTDVVLDGPYQVDIHCGKAWDRFNRMAMAAATHFELGDRNFDSSVRDCTDGKVNIYLVSFFLKDAGNNRDRVVAWLKSKGYTPARVSQFLPFVAQHKEKIGGALCLEGLPSTAKLLEYHYDNSAPTTQQLFLLKQSVGSKNGPTLSLAQVNYSDTSEYLTVAVVKA